MLTPLQFHDDVQFVPVLVGTCYNIVSWNGSMTAWKAYHVLKTKKMGMYKTYKPGVVWCLNILKENLVSI